MSPPQHASTLPTQDLVVEKRGRIWLVKLNRPEVLNALRKQTLLELNSTIDELALDSSGAVMVLTGQGKAFSAGGDIRELQEMTEGDARVYGRLAQNTMKKMLNIEKPLIAAVNGPALGAGFDLVTACDLAIASKTATFGSPTLKLGILTPFGGDRRLPQMIGLTRAKHLIFTAETLDAQAALDLGLLNKVVSPESLIDDALLLAESVAEKAPIALGFIKRLANLSVGGGDSELDDLEVDFYSKCFRTTDRSEGVNAFLEKRKPVFTGK
jgi:enoyl-CoA hydratase